MGKRRTSAPPRPRTLRPRTGFLLILLGLALHALSAADPAASPSPAGTVAPKPLFRDPVFDGAADPIVVWNPHISRWWMFYADRDAPTHVQLPVPSP